MKRYLLIVFFGIFISCSFTRAQKCVSQWTPAPMVIDGSSSEWPEFARFRNDKIGLSYDIRNDHDNLYLLFRVPDGTLQMRLMHAGMQVSVKVKSWSSVSFPAMPLGRPEDEDLTLNIRATGDKYLKALASNTSLEGFVYAKKLENTGGGNCKSVSYAINWTEEGEMMYEIGIPFCELYGEEFIFSKIAGSALILRAESRAFNASSNAISEDNGNTGEHAVMSVHFADQDDGLRLECKFTLAEQK
jgi:hypothetical protein